VRMMKEFLPDLLVKFLVVEINWLRPVSNRFQLLEGSTVYSASKGNLLGKWLHG
jgi:hypothetical protein